MKRFPINFSSSRFARLAALAGLAVLTARASAEGFGGGKYSWESEFRFGMTGRSEFHGNSQRARSEAMDFDARSILSIQVKEGILVRLGFEWDRLGFGVSRGAALPTRLQGSSLVLGTDLQLGEGWIARVDVQPGFYTSRADFRTEDFNVPITLGASYFVSADLQLVAGVSIDLNRKYPVLPGAGFRWKFAADWVLDAILPAPRLEYNLSKAVLLYVGGDFQGGTYRVDGDFGDAHRRAELNNAMVDYTQIRVGGGASWTISREVTLEVEAGCVPYEEFDYHRVGFRLHSNGTPPYGGLSLKAAF